MTEQEKSVIEERAHVKAQKFFTATGYQLVTDTHFKLFVAMLMESFHEGACYATDQALAILHRTQSELGREK